jgi:hypothetical protein
MDGSHESDDVIRPDLLRRTSGGWLAVAPKSAKFAIGVTAMTPEEAEEKFRSAYGRLVSLLEPENT